MSLLSSVFSNPQCPMPHFPVSHFQSLLGVAPVTCRLLASPILSSVSFAVMLLVNYACIMPCCDRQCYFFPFSFYVSFHFHFSTLRCTAMASGGFGRDAAVYFSPSPLPLIFLTYNLRGTTADITERSLSEFSARQIAANYNLSLYHRPLYSTTFLSFRSTDAVTSDFQFDVDLLVSL